MYQVDAFTADLFKGNSAAVCVLDGGQKWLKDRIMAEVAKENNLAETSFCYK